MSVEKKDTTDAEQVPLGTRTTWTRRHFIAVGATSLGAAALAGTTALGGRNSGLTAELLNASTFRFDRVRSRPGHGAVLELVAPGLRGWTAPIEVVLLRSHAPLGRSLNPGIMDVVALDLSEGESRVDIGPPMVEMNPAERANEGYFVTAWLTDGDGQLLLASDPVEVVISPFSLGM